MKYYTLPKENIKQVDIDNFILAEKQFVSIFQDFHGGKCERCFRYCSSRDVIENMFYFHGRFKYLLELFSILRAIQESMQSFHGAQCQISDGSR